VEVYPTRGGKGSVLITFVGPLRVTHFSFGFRPPGKGPPL